MAGWVATDPAGGCRVPVHRIVPGWDLARSQGLEVTFDEDWATGAFHGMSAMGPALHASGQFGTPQPVGEDAPIQDRLLALLGRDPHWSPGA